MEFYSIIKAIDNFRLVNNQKQFQIQSVLFTSSLISFYCSSVINNIEFKSMSLNDFTFLSKIGEGSYSSVHKVRRISDNQLYALKQVKMNTLNQKQKLNSLNEVRLLASINSDYIIKYKEAFFDTKTNTLCIVMQHADGGDLQKLITKKKKVMGWVDQKEVIKMMKHILTALSFMHAKNIIHRDIKSANIFISNGVFKIADLNVSKVLRKELAYTQTGTPYYASPQVWQDKPYELKSDIWSFGCIAFQLCALKPPFTGSSMQGLYRKVMKGVYPRIPNIYSAKIVKLIDMCLQLDSRKRPTAQQLLKILDEGKQQKRAKSTSESINLLNTIKIPKNIESLKHNLPKSDYNQMIQKLLPTQNVSQYQGVNLNRLREIVRAKRQQKKPQKRRVHSQMPLSLQYEDEEKSLHGKQLLEVKKEIRQYQNEGLPKINYCSEPRKLDKINEMLLKVREQRDCLYEPRRPIWWG